jgi:uncharacterized membrane protein YsdA (DUF1294 family)/cold shock CspA family protein
MRFKGKISQWQDDKGFGFITPFQGGKQVFVHINSFPNKVRRPLKSEIVTYSLKNDAKGRRQADAVLFAGERLPKASSGPSRFPPGIVVIFVFLVTAMWFMGVLPSTVLLLYCSASLIAFIAYAMDKSAAQNQRWRTPESSLHLLALAGGWPGAFAAQRVLRHKSSKQSFLVTFWITVAINCIALGWLFSASGSAAFSFLTSLDKALSTALASAL